MFNMSIHIHMLDNKKKQFIILYPPGHIDEKLVKKRNVAKPILYIYYIYN